ncbi:MAG: isochorismatase family protein, partial [Proteobacteria bacterium]
MSTLRFRLSSEQLELLLAFENALGLNDLAEKMGRDPSVISRGLQKIAEEYPVLDKVKGRWQLTQLGRNLNALTTAQLSEHHALLNSHAISRKLVFSMATPSSALIILNAQKGLLDSTLPGRNNSEAEANIGKLLNYGRSHGLRIVHVKHLSHKPESIFYSGSAGADFLDELTPLPGEAVIEKTKSSGFAETDLET